MNLLVLEDNPDHLELTLEMLNDSYGTHAQIHSCSKLAAAIDYLANHRVDVFLCDLQLPDSPVANTVARLRDLQDAPPIIVLSSLNDEQLAQELVKHGIQDFLPKDELSPSLLVRACNYAIERRKLSRALLDKNADYQAFCYSLTHDFRSSLWQIARACEIFKAKTRTCYPDDHQMPWQYLDKVPARVDDIQRLVDDLQSYLALDAVPASFGPCDLTQSAHNAVDLLADTIDLSGVSIAISPLPAIVGSSVQMQLLFSNLIGNSVKYNHSETPCVSIYIAEQNDQQAVIAVRDNGIGIPAKLRERIFTPFERLHTKDEYPGSGLGLSIVRRIAQYHGGNIQVASEPGEGSTFLLRLPLPQG